MTRSGLLYSHNRHTKINLLCRNYIVVEHRENRCQSLKIPTGLAEIDIRLDPRNGGQTGQKCDTSIKLLI